MNESNHIESVQEKIHARENFLGLLHRLKIVENYLKLCNGSEAAWCCQISGVLSFTF